MAAASLHDQSILSTDPGFTQRVRASIVAAAIAISNEGAVTLHTQRDAVAVGVISNPNYWQETFAASIATDATSPGRRPRQAPWPLRQGTSPRRLPLSRTRRSTRQFRRSGTASSLIKNVIAMMSARIFLIPEEPVVRLLNYLVQRPYHEVADFVTFLQRLTPATVVEQSASEPPPPMPSPEPEMPPVNLLSNGKSSDSNG